MLIEVNGVQIQFPFEPYQLQRDYMSRVISALDNKQNAVLESPTGKNIFKISQVTEIIFLQNRNRQNFVPSNKFSCLDDQKES